ncbi:hypothetical protein V5799_023765 [Amblyomma americanum]|uniref:Peptidase M13 C-terminal domain-containing protein n=1 Tax=Amblyomma americanum TaxID=6943 RepID=A0AAQ4FGX3_AMBAM
MASSFLGVAVTISAITVGLSVLSYRNGGDFFGMGRNSWNECRSKLCLVHFRRLEGLWFSVRVSGVHHGRRLVRVGPGIVSGAWKKALDTAVLRGVYNARVRRFYDVMRTNNFVPISDNYINARYPPPVRSAVDGVLTSVTQTAIDLFLKTTWIDAESREVAVDKLRRVSTALWPPDAQMNASETDALLEHFPEPRDDLFRYWLDALAARRALLGRRDLEGAFLSEDVQSQRALFRYHYYANELAVSLQALYSPLFVEGGGRAVNLAGLGAQYAAALARAFDPRGVLLEGRGSASGLWWGRASYHEYEQRTTACGTAVPTNGSGGTLEPFEGVAAIEIAYAAFNTARSMSDRARWWKRRDFLGLSEDQAFFVTFCQAYCAREPSDRQRLSCTLPLKNYRPFAAAFTCPAASPMNPHKRCGFFESDSPHTLTRAASSTLQTQPSASHQSSGDDAVTLAKMPFGKNMF